MFFTLIMNEIHHDGKTLYNKFITDIKTLYTNIIKLLIQNDNIHPCFHGDVVQKAYIKSISDTNRQKTSLKNLIHKGYNILIEVIIIYLPLY